jgi:hypothetical protein
MKTETTTYLIWDKNEYQTIKGENGIYQLAMVPHGYAFGRDRGNDFIAMEDSFFSDKAEAFECYNGIVQDIVKYS